MGAVASFSSLPDTTLYWDLREEEEEGAVLGAELDTGRLVSSWSAILHMNTESSRPPARRHTMPPMTHVVICVELVSGGDGGDGCCGGDGGWYGDGGCKGDGCAGGVGADGGKMTDVEAADHDSIKTSRTFSAFSGSSMNVSMDPASAFAVAVSASTSSVAFIVMVESTIRLPGVTSNSMEDAGTAMAVARLFLNCIWSNVSIV